MNLKPAQKHSAAMRRAIFPLFNHCRSRPGCRQPDGSGSTTVDVPAGKDYYLGLDVRKADKGTWK